MADTKPNDMVKTFITTILIFLATTVFSQTRSKADAKMMADSLYSQIVSGQKSAALIARLYSEDPGSAKEGGRIQFNPGKNQLIPAFEDAVLQLKIGETSKPFETEYGYHIVQVEAKSDALIQIRHILITFKR